MYHGGHTYSATFSVLLNHDETEDEFYFIYNVPNIQILEKNYQTRLQNTTKISIILNMTIFVEKQQIFSYLPVHPCNIISIINNYLCPKH